MILHIGAKEMVSHKDIVAILRYDVLVSTRGGREYIKGLKEGGRLRDISGGRPGSLVVLTNGCYLSAISAPTLVRRLEEDAALSLTESEQDDNTLGFDPVKAV